MSIQHVVLLASNKPEMTFVGYMVSQKGIGMDPAKVSSILD